jgi:4,5-DOPA dioxygenase extradiol
MPVLFVGHGNPMNAIENNEFTGGWRKSAESMEKPSAILCISAHWETNGTFVTSMAKPKTIHDFGGFPQKLYEFQYPAPGNPELAEEAKSLVPDGRVSLDDKWGLDHGTWSVLCQMYPDASIPVIQLSLDYNMPAQGHYDLAKELTSLRKKGVLIIGSGNLVHNLREVDWSGKHESKGFDWAIEANDKIKSLIMANDHQQLINYKKSGTAMGMAVPTPEHYLPLLYVLGLKHESEKVTFFNDKSFMGSLSMTSVLVAG